MKAIIIILYLIVYSVIILNLLSIKGEFLMFSFKGKVSIVTGGTRGIGKETALLLSKFGSKVIASYRNNRYSADKLKEQDNEILPFEGDISEEDTAKALIEYTYSSFGRADYLVNSAGIWTPLTAGSFNVKEWDNMIKNNLRSVYLVTDYLIQKWLRAGTSGRIVNIASTAGVRGESKHAHYASSKAGIIAYTKSLCSELSARGIIVNCVAPGWVDTEMNAEIFRGRGKDDIIETIPIQRVPKPEEVAYPVLFLLSDYASAISGEVLNVNGGSVLCG